MREWLPEGLESPETMEARGERALAGVRARVGRFERRRRAGRWAAGAVIVAVVAFALAPRLGRFTRGPVEGARLPSQAARVSRPDISVAKEADAVQVSWKGDPSKDYIVYRCTSPRFDQCSIAGAVKGTKWTDRGAERASLVFYKVEPKAGA